MIINGNEKKWQDAKVFTVQVVFRQIFLLQRKQIGNSKMTLIKYQLDGNLYQKPPEHEITELKFYPKSIFIFRLTYIYVYNKNSTFIV